MGNGDADDEMSGGGASPSAKAKKKRNNASSKLVVKKSGLKKKHLSGSFRNKNGMDVDNSDNSEEDSTDAALGEVLNDGIIRRESKRDVMIRKRREKMERKGI